VEASQASLVDLTKERLLGVHGT